MSYKGEELAAAMDTGKACRVQRSTSNQRRVTHDPKNGSWQPLVMEKAKHSHCFGTDPATLGSSPIG